jgi:serine/threonine protein kinase
MPAPEKLGRYKIVDRLAVGGMAEIYIAQALGAQNFQKEYVLKLIHPKYVGDHEFIRMLVDEAKLTASLNHQNIAQVNDLDVDGENYFIVMEYVRGKDLYQLLADAYDQRKRFPLDVAAFIASEVAAGLNYAHNKLAPDGSPLNLVHRDISPQNLLVSFQGEVKIVDFGVAKAAMGARPETQAGIIKGKFRYMSPEQAWGEKLDGRSDLFSAALCLYEMVTGMTAYEDTGDMRAMLLKMREAKVRDVRDFRPDCDPALIEIINRGLAKSRHDRFATGREMQVSLLEYVHTISPGFHAGRVTDFMVQLFPEDAKRYNLDVEMAEDITGATVDLAPTEETTNDRKVPNLGAQPDADTDPEGEDFTVRRSLSSADMARRAGATPDDSFEAGETEVFQSQMGRPSPFAAAAPDPEAGETSSMTNDNLLKLIEATSKPGQRAPVPPNGATSGPPGLSPSGPVPDFTKERQRMSGVRADDPVARFLRTSLPESLANPALDLHRKIDRSLNQEGPARFVVPALGFAIFVLIVAILATFLV